MTEPGKALAVVPPEVLRVRQLLEQRRHERDVARLDFKISQFNRKKAEFALATMTRSRQRWFGTAVVIGLLGIFSAAGGAIVVKDTLDDMRRDYTAKIEGLAAENAEQDHVIDQLGERLDVIAGRTPTL